MLGDKNVACLTPELASVLGEKIAALKRQIDEHETRIEDLRAAKAAVADSGDLMRAAVEHAKNFEAPVETTSFFERREFLRGVLASATVDPDGDESRAVFYALPRLAAKKTKSRHARGL